MVFKNSRLFSPNWKCDLIPPTRRKQTKARVSLGESTRLSSEANSFIFSRCRRIADVVYFRMLSSSHSGAASSMPSMLVDPRTAVIRMLDRPNLLLLVHDLDRGKRTRRIGGLKGNSGNDSTCCRRQRRSFPFSCNKDFAGLQ